MRNHTLNKVLLATLLLASTAARAQYAWIDEKGVHQYSDKPPPPDTPQANILKMPRPSMPSTPATSATTAASKPPPGLAEREADYVKRHAEADKAAAKAAADRSALDARRARCQSAAAVKAEIDTGRRMRTPAGTVMTEDDKVAEIARADAVLKDCRQAPD